ncbi:GNAT family N-acetyltransferase [bacterium]|nr:GNAT family N-acetyltransferase [bacterium]
MDNTNESETMKIRPAEIHEKSIILHLMSEAFKHIEKQIAGFSFGKRTEQFNEIAEEKIERLFKDKKSKLFVVEYLNVLVGYIIARIEIDKSYSKEVKGILTEVWVSKDHKDQDTTQKLIKTAETWLIENGAETIQATWNHNDVKEGKIWQGISYTPMAMTSIKML